jgi:ketosteroid isomerase-like protein
MRRMLLPSALALLLSSNTGAQTTTPGSGSLPAGRQSAVEQELIVLDQRFDEARRTGDAATIAGYLTDDFTYVGANAVVRNRAEVLKTVEARTSNPLPRPVDAPRPTYTVTVHGDTAVMTHLVRPGGTVMHVFVRQQGRWKMAAWTAANDTPSLEASINSAGYN